MTSVCASPRHPTRHPTAQSHATLGVARQRTVESGWDEALVVDCAGIVVGRLRGSA